MTSVLDIRSTQTFLTTDTSMKDDGITRSSQKSYPKKLSHSVEQNLLMSNIKSAVVGDTMFRALRIYTNVIPHTVPNPCINAMEINGSATNLVDCVDELTYLKEQAVASLKKHSMLVAYDLLQCGMLDEIIVLNLEDDDGNKLIKEDLDEDFEEEEIEEEESDEEEEGELDEEYERDADANLKFDKIKLAMARKLVDIIYKESAGLAKVSTTKGKLIWLDRIKTTLGLSGVDSVQQWLDKLSDAARSTDIMITRKFYQWKIPRDNGLNASRETYLTTVEIWKEIRATLLDNLEVGEKLVEQLLKRHIINEHTKLNLLCLPNRKAKVIALLRHMESMGSTVMYIFGECLVSTGQKHLGRIVVKRLNDNKITHHSKTCSDRVV